jgi:hypothetical protein
MGRRPALPYTCPCCGYTTNRKDNMTFHLYKLKKHCPRTLNDITLTEEVKLYILENRVYHIPKPPESNTQVLNQTINNYNYIQNFIANMDIMKKLNKYTEYNNIGLIDFEDKIGENYAVTSQKLDEDKFKYGFELKTQDLIEIIDDISSMPDNKLEYFNLVYDSHINKLKLYDGGAWKSLLIEQGIKQILIITKEYYLDKYESYLLRKIRNTDNLMEKQKCNELLKEYYKFIACFEIDPFVKDHNDSDILNNSNNSSSDYQMQDTYYQFFQKVQENLTKGEITKMKREVAEIVKRNTKQNIHELNNRVLNLIHMDEEFKKIFLQVSS